MLPQRANEALDNTLISQITAGEKSLPLQPVAAKMIVGHASRRIRLWNSWNIFGEVCNLPNHRRVLCRYFSYMLLTYTMTQQYADDWAAIYSLVADVYYVSTLNDVFMEESDTSVHHGLCHYQYKNFKFIWQASRFSQNRSCIFKRTLVLEQRKT